MSPPAPGMNPQQILRESRRSLSTDLRRRSRPDPTAHGGRPQSHVEHEATSFHPLNGIRQDTLDSQGSQDSQSSDKSTNRLRNARRRRLSDADRNKPPTAPVSMMSLPEYRDSKPQLYWPTSGSSSELHQVDKFAVAENPSNEFRRHEQLIQRTEKSQIWSVVLLMHNRRQEHVALKLMPCEHAANTEDFKNGIKREYDLLAKLDHKHIIAPVGSYVEGQPGTREYGLLLFPLAPYSLRVLLGMISEHNKKRSKPQAEWVRDIRATQLLDYFACLCQAVIYLHSQKFPIKHKDIKCENVLVDKHGTVILADFDIAKQYTDRKLVVTTGATAHTAEVAPQNVKDGRQRGLESDVFSLGCVFLETASVAFGETSQTYRKHLCGGKDGGICDHSEALDLGTINTWIDHLKTLASESPQQVPTGHFGKTTTADVSRDVGQFLDMISAMLNVKLGDNQEELLASAWRCFSKFSSKTCPHCCTGTETDRDARPGLRVPITSARKQSTWTRVETISEGSSGSSMNGDTVMTTSVEDDGRFKVDQSIALLKKVAAANPTAAVPPVLPTVSMIAESRLTGVPVDDLGGKDLKKTDSRLDQNNPSSNSDSIASALRKHSAPEITLSIASNDHQPGVHQTDRGHPPTSTEAGKRINGDKIRVPQPSLIHVVKDGSSALLATTQDVQPTSAGAFQETEKGRKSQTPDSRNSDETDDSDRRQPTHPPRARPEADITPNFVRVLTFTPRERRGLSKRGTDAILNTRLLMYQNDKFTVTKPDIIDQDFLNGAFFDIPPDCNVSYRMPSSLGRRGGELLHLRRNLSWAHILWCWAGRPWQGLPRIRLMYVPGYFSDKALEECVNMS